MGELLSFLSYKQKPEIPDISFVRHAQKKGGNGDISALGRLNSLKLGFDLASRLEGTNRMVLIDYGNIDRVLHTADEFQSPLEETGIDVQRRQKHELSGDSIFIDPESSELRRKVRDAFADNTYENKSADEKMGQLLLEWMDKGELGYGIADGTVSFHEARIVQAYWLAEAFGRIRESYRQQEASPVILRFTHEIQSFVIATFAEKRDRRGRVKETGEEIVRQRKGITKNLTGPSFYYHPRTDAFTVKLPRFNKNGNIHSYEELSVNEELIHELAKKAYSIPEAVLQTKYDESPSLLIRTMRRQIAKGHPIIPSIRQQPLAA